LRDDLCPDLREALPHFSVLSHFLSPLTQLHHESPQEIEGSKAADILFQEQPV